MIAERIARVSRLHFTIVLARVLISNPQFNLLYLRPINIPKSHPIKMAERPG